MFYIVSILLFLFSPFVIFAHETIPISSDTVQCTFSEDSCHIEFSSVFPAAVLPGTAATITWKVTRVSGQRPSNCYNNPYFVILRNGSQFKKIETDNDSGSWQYTYSDHNTTTSTKEYYCRVRLSGTTGTVYTIQTIVDVCPNSKLCSSTFCSVCLTTYCGNHQYHQGTKLYPISPCKSSSGHSFCSTNETEYTNWVNQYGGDNQFTNCPSCSVSYCKLCGHECGSDAFCPNLSSCKITTCTTCKTAYCSIHTVHSCTGQSGSESGSDSGSGSGSGPGDTNVTVNIDVDGIIKAINKNTVQIQDSQNSIQQTLTTTNTTITEVKDVASDISTAADSIQQTLITTNTTISEVKDFASDISTTANDINKVTSDIENFLTESVSSSTPTVSNLDISSIKEQEDYVKSTETIEPISSSDWEDRLNRLQEKLQFEDLSVNDKPLVLSFDLPTSFYDFSFNLDLRGGDHEDLVSDAAAISYAIFAFGWGLGLIFLITKSLRQW